MGLWKKNLRGSLLKIGMAIVMAAPLFWVTDAFPATHSFDQTKGMLSVD
jgi:hypothetical protein